MDMRQGWLMSKIIHYAILFSFVLCLSACTTGAYFLNGVETEGVSQTEIRGKTYEFAKSETGVDYIAYAQPTYDGDEIQFTIGISNSSESDYYFSDSSIEVFRGNYETDEWESLGRWDAKGYYQEMYNKMKTEETLAAIAGALSVINSAFGYTSTSRVATPYGTSYITTRTYSPAMTGLTALAASAQMDVLTTNNRVTLQSLEETLLFSSTVPAKSDYIGNAYVDVDNRSPEYKLSLMSDDGIIRDFVFSRSDRYEVLHPWSDQTRDRHSITFSHALWSDRMQLSYFWSRREGVGMYTGMSFYNMFKGTGHSENAPGYFYSTFSSWDNFSFDEDPDPTDRWDYTFYYDGHVNLEKGFSKGIGIPVGIDFRVFPNTWLVAGLDFIFNVTTYSLGTIQYKNPDGEIKSYPGTYWFNGLSSEEFFDFGLQVGLNFITNFLDFNIMATYVIPDRFYLDLGAGFAF